MNALSTLAAVAVLALASQAFGVEGNGTIKQESRTVGEFRAVTVAGGILAMATLGEKGSLKIEADENLLALVETQVKDGVLVIRTRESVRPSKPIKATIVATKLESAEASGGSRLSTMASAGRQFAARASGGADVVVEGIAVDEAVADASGGATVKLAGKAKKLTAHSSGGAKVQAYELPVEAAQAESSGGARVELAASNEVGGHASGGASIHVKGEPAKSQVKTSGGGRVVKE
jgi:hypothetical protein